MMLQVLNNYRYESTWIWADIMWCAMRDCALITPTHKALEAIGCKVYSTGFRDYLENFEEQPHVLMRKIPKLELEDMRAVIESYKDDIKTNCPFHLNALNFGTDDDFWDTRPATSISKSEHEHLLLSEIHLYPEAATFVHEYVEKIDNQTWEFIDSWKEKYSNKDPIILQDLQWSQSEKIGWSDDRWRPNMSMTVIGLDLMMEQ